MTITLSTTHASPAGAHTTEQRGQAVQVVGAGTFTDEQMGAQLTDQYRKAVGGMTEVLRFGAMMMGLRSNLSTRGQIKRGPSKDGGIDGWLEQNAPEIKRATAYRFLHVAEAVARDFQLPAKVSFIELATTEFSKLPEKLQQKQSELWEFVNGTSQRSWLDRFSPPNPATLHRLHPANAGVALPPPSPEEVEKFRRDEVMKAFAEFDKLIDRKDWHYLTDDQIRLSIEVFGDYVRKAKEYVAIPRHERTARKLKALAAK